MSSWIRQPFYATLLLLLSILICHFFIAGQVNLTVDGAHYALYSQHLAWSYFDHPPMVGWLPALVTSWSHSDFAFRLIPMLLSFIWPLLLYKLVRILFPQTSAWLAFLAVALTQSMTLLFLLAIAYTPQVSLITFCLLTCIATWQAIQFGHQRDWWLAGIALGLAGLSDYTALCLAAAIAVFIFIQRPRCLLTAGPWLTLMVAMLFITPVIYWNWQHDWLSIRFQLQHGAGNPHWSWTIFLQSQFIQFIAYTPLLYITGYFILFRSAYWWRQPAIQFIGLIALSYLLVFLWSAGHTRVLPHWPSLGWIFTMVLLAYHIQQHWSRWHWRLLSYTIFTYAIGSIIFFISLAYYFWLPLPLLSNPIHDLYGWPIAATIAKQELSSVPHDDKLAPGLFVTNWTLASRLAWYSQLPVQIADNHSQTNQFDLWFGRPVTGAYGIVVVPAGWQVNQGETAGNFSHCQLQRQIAIQKQGKLLNQFALYYCYGFHAHS